MEVTSTEAMHAANTPHESDDPISAIDEIEGCQSALAETQILGKLTFTSRSIPPANALQCHMNLITR